MGDEKKDKGRTKSSTRKAAASLAGRQKKVKVRLSASKPECYVGTLSHSEHSADGVQDGLVAGDPEKSLLQKTKVAPVLSLDLCAMYAATGRLPPTCHLLFVRVPGDVKKDQLRLRATFHDATERPDELEPVEHTFAFDLPELAARPCYLIFLPVFYDGDPPEAIPQEDDEDASQSLDEVEAFYRDADVHLLDVTDDSAWGHAKTIDIGYEGKDDTLRSAVTLSLAEFVPPVDIDETTVSAE